MNNKRNNSNNKNGKLRNSKSKYRRQSNKTEKNNFQDEFSDNEFIKGAKFAASKMGPKSNDPQWYFKSEQVLKDVASFSFSKPLGTYTYPRRYYATGATANPSHCMASIPGLMSMTLALSPGISDDAQDPLNLAATNVYSYVRYKNSGAANYDAPDLMLYLIAMDSLYACWNWMKRIYGMASTYSQTNRYKPIAYMTANGVDFDDIIHNLADFRAYLNVKANEIAAFCVPATMSYNIRHSWLFSNVYKDGDTNKSQEYIFVPAFFYQYDETSTPNGGKLEPVNILTGYDPNTFTKLKFADLRNIMNTMLERVNYSEDIGIMSGDILKAYGEGGLFTLSEFDADYKVEAVYNREVLTQIENASPVFTTADDSASFAIIQDPDTNFLKYDPRVTTNQVPTKQHYLNFHWESPTPQDVMVATRLIGVVGEVDTTADNKRRIGSCGSEIFISGYIYQFVTGDGSYPFGWAPEVPGNMVLYALPLYPEKGFGSGTENDDATLVWQMLSISKFDWHPTVDYSFEFDNGNVAYLGFMLDFDKYTLLDIQDIQSLNLVALLTEFNVPN